MFFFFSSRRRHTRCLSDWSSDVCSSDLIEVRDTGVADLDVHLVPGRCRGERDLSGGGIADRVAQKISKDALQQHGIARYDASAAIDREAQALGRGLG